MKALKHLPRRDLPMMLTRVLDPLRALVEAGYFSLDVEGAELVPRRGPVVYVGNHAGWFALDAIMGALALVDHVGAERLPYAAVQDQLLMVPGVGGFFEGIGSFPASWLREPRSLPPEMSVFAVYPEGAEGNCKPFWRAYRMRRWRSGFAHLAAAMGATIVPVATLGGEECFPSAGTLRLLRPLLGTVFPVPLFPLPLPSRWKIVFHEPVRFDDVPFSGGKEDLKRFLPRARALTASVRATVQDTLDREAANRFLGRLSRRVRPVTAEAKASPLPALEEVEPFLSSAGLAR